jgi:hypothetical protein
MRCWLSVFAIGCGSSTNPPRPPDRAADVLIAAPPELVVLYRDGDGDWQHAPRIASDLIGFDLESDRYAVAVVDVANTKVTSLYTTLQEHPDLVLHAPTDVSVYPITGTVRGFGVNGASVFGATARTGVTRTSPTFVIDVPQGIATIAASKFNEDFVVDSLIVRRDVPVTQPLEIDLDFDAEALAPTRTPTTGQVVCGHNSTFFLGATELPLATLSRRHYLVPHPDHWRAGDRLSVSRFCGPGVAATDDLVSPDQSLPELRLPPALGGVDFDADRFRFAWTAYEAPVRYELVVAGSLCGNSELSGALPLFGDFCAHRWTSNVSEGWAAAGGTELDVLSRATLEGLGVWDDTLELQHPLFWEVLAHRDGADHRTRAFEGGTVP